MTYSSSYRRILNRMGYYSYQSGLIFRHINQGERWDNHLQNCRAFILKAIGLYNPEFVTVLGSGWLLDLPLAEMIEKKIRIRLVDIVHPPEVRDQVAQFRNIELSEEDVTGGLIEEVWNMSGKGFLFNKIRSLNDINIPVYKPTGDQGMIISLNILTQLESLIVSFLEKNTSEGVSGLQELRTEIQEKHLDFLKLHPSVLITDIAEVFKTKSAQESKVPTLLATIPEGRYSEEWIWDFDLTGTDYNNKKSVLNIKAVII